MRHLALAITVLALTGCPDDNASNAAGGTPHLLLAAKCKAATKAACDELDTKCKDGDQSACDARKEAENAKPNREPGGRGAGKSSASTGKSAKPAASPAAPSSSAK